MQPFDAIISPQPLLQSQQQEARHILSQKLDSFAFGKWHLYVVTSLGITWLFDGYEVAILPLVAVELKQHFAVSESQIGLIASFYLAGCTAGALGFGYMASTQGRKKIFSITLLIYGCSVFMIFLANSYYMFLLCKFCTGLAIGGEYTSVFAVIDELMPKNLRGRVNIILESTWNVGALFAAIITLCFHNSLGYEITWKILFILGGVSSIPLYFMRKKLPESPRWLVNQGLLTEAELVVDHIAYCCENEIVIAIDEYKLVGLGRRRQSLFPNLYQEDMPIEQTTNFIDIIKYILNRYPQRFLLCLTLMTTQFFFYQGIFNTYSLILEKLYSVQKKQISLFMIPIVSAGIVGPWVFGKYFDIYGRRKMIFLTYGGSSILLAINAVMLQQNGLNLTGQCLLWFALFTVSSPGIAASYLTVSEIFPTRFRSQAIAIFFSLGLALGGIIAPYFFGALISDSSRYQVSLGYYVAAFLMFIGSMAGIFFGIDAENKSLEVIQSF